MVGIVLVSHSRPLATAALEFVQSLTKGQVPLGIAAGAGENHAEFGTDATEILDAVKAVMGEEGVLILMDMGSALLSAQTALDLLEEEVRAKVRLCSAPFFEGAIAAAVTASIGESLDQVA